MILNRQDAKVAKKDYFRDKKLGALGVLAVNPFLSEILRNLEPRVEEAT